MKTLRLFAMVMALIVITAGCGSDDTDQAEGSNSSGENGAASGDTSFVYANPFPVFDLDPASAFSSENVVLQNVYESLTIFNPPGSAEMVSPWLAESWTSNDDATEWTFTLREGVTFHDGSELTAEAVRASLQRTIDLDLGAAFILAPIAEMAVVDDLNITFTLAYPAPLDIVMSSQYGAYIMSTDAVAQDNDWFNAGNEAGTGPYTISSFEPNVVTELARYDDYWGGWEDNQFDQVEIHLVEDPVLAEQMIRGGDADFTYNLPSDSYGPLEGEDQLTVVRGESMRNLFGLLNHERLSPEVREALVLSFPYDDVVSSLYAGESTRAHGIVPQAVWGSAELDLPATDLDRAGEIVADAGAEGLSVTYSFDAGSTEQQNIGEIWKANLATIGIDLVLDPLTFDARWELAQADPANAQDVFTMFWFPTFVTPYDFLFSLFHSEDEPFFNLGYYSNPQFDDLIDEADAVSGSDVDAAIELFREAQQILVDDNAAVFMVDVPNIAVVRADVDGYTPNPAYDGVVRFYDLRRAS